METQAQEIARLLADRATREILESEVAEVWYPSPQTPLDVLMASE